jgi:hypothetical protein
VVACVEPEGFLNLRIRKVEGSRGERGPVGRHIQIDGDLEELVPGGGSESHEDVDRTIDNQDAIPKDDTGVILNENLSVQGKVPNKITNFFRVKRTEIRHPFYDDLPRNKLRYLTQMNPCHVKVPEQRG